MFEQNKFSCFIIGKESLLVQCAEIILQQGHQLKGVITAEKSIIAWAKKKGLMTMAPGKGLATRLKPFAFDYLFSITHLSIIPDKVLALPNQGAINFHDGPLPRYAGLHATTWAILNQETEHGITWHSIESGVDTGKILKQQHFPISKEETAFTLNVKCYEAAIESFATLVNEIETDSLSVQEQDFSERTYFGKYQRPQAAGLISWNQPALKIDGLVRGLDFGDYANPLTLAKLWAGNKIFMVKSLIVPDFVSRSAPGTITDMDEDWLQIATETQEVVVQSLHNEAGREVSIKEFMAQTGLQVGDQLIGFDEDNMAPLTVLHQTLSRYESFWLKQSAQVSPLQLPFANQTTASDDAPQFEASLMRVPEQAKNDFLAAAFALYLTRLNGNQAVDLGFSTSELRGQITGFEQLFASQVPLHVDIAPVIPVSQAIEQVQAHIQKLIKRKTFARDMQIRHPGLPVADLSVSVDFVSSMAEFVPQPHAGLQICLTDTGEMGWVYDTAVYSSHAIANMQQQFGSFLANMSQDAQAPLGTVALLSAEERHKMLVTWNETAVSYPTNKCIHQLFEEQVARTPNATAAVFEDQHMSYAELNGRANQLARTLQKMDISTDTPVGIFMDRSLDMLISLLAVLKAGGAYLPLDPDYPKDRIAFMVEDARVPVLLTQSSRINDLPPHQARVIPVDASWALISFESKDNLETNTTPDSLSYIIYTSGSTGKPKGVMVQHGNVVNFFTGMDQRIPHATPGTWLAVTSLSFDISVLELFWTLTRGFKLILYSDKSGDKVATQTMSPEQQKKIDFSLFFWASDEEAQGVTDKYRLLLEASKFGDQNGFSAVWTPERHFHGFGGLYPNPSVTGAAVAAITENIHIRSGSCVIPLHSPIRIAEEWSVVDNISNGRVGLAAAAGWQPNDFVLQPKNHANRKSIMFRDIETVRKLWRGETVNFPGPDGKDVPLHTMPRPVQAELPIWMTVAGNPETFQMAGEHGYNILTHLLGQTVEEVAEKLDIYRTAWQAAEHPGEGHVTVMLHTLIGENQDEVREIARGPMKSYLNSAVGLVAKAAWHFPTFKTINSKTGQSPMEVLNSDTLSEKDMDSLLDFAFERYYQTSGLFGTPEHALKMVNKLKQIGVDEVGCLIDYGIETDTVLDSLKHLLRLKELAEPIAVSNYSVPSLIQTHTVTHLQCTPSMASMFLMDAPSRKAISTLQTFMIGGEAFPTAMSGELNELVAGDIINMYGPTETTIWSTTHPVTELESPVSIGQPIANTDIYILDNNFQPVPVGIAGNLYIGGAGVVRGYLNRPQLTAEHFIQHPFKDDPSARIYNTGDMARYRADGNIEFLGRVDNQVKIRGYRIEMGEIENLLTKHASVNKAVVIVREDAPGDKRLVAYLIPELRQTISSQDLREQLRKDLPEFMIPAHYVSLDNFPLTPNLKIDRRALPAPEQIRSEMGSEFVAPQTPIEKSLAEIWMNALGLDKISVQDNFFELGGHSLSAVQVAFQIRQSFGVDLPLQSFFRVPTLAGLAQFLEDELVEQTEDDELANLLQELEHMSDEEAELLLAAAD